MTWGIHDLMEAVFWITIAASVALNAVSVLARRRALWEMLEQRKRIEMTELEAWRKEWEK